MRSHSSFLFMLPLLVLSGCAFGPKHPCQDAGDPAREKPTEFKGNRQCIQKKGPDGKYVNNGPYIEWYPSGKRALVGEYKMGKKNGKWFEYDEQGKLLSEKWYEDGVQTLTRSKTSIPSATPPPPTQDGDSRDRRR